MVHTTAVVLPPLGLDSKLFLATPHSSFFVPVPFVHSTLFPRFTHPSLPVSCTLLHLLLFSSTLPTVLSSSPTTPDPDPLYTRLGLTWTTHPPPLHGLAPRPLHPTLHTHSLLPHSPWCRLRPSPGPCIGSTGHSKAPSSPPFDLSSSIASPSTTFNMSSSLFSSPFATGSWTSLCGLSYPSP